MKPTKDLSNQSIYIRSAIDSDLPAIVEIYNDAIPGRMATADLEPITIENRLSWFHDRDRRTYPIWVADRLVSPDHNIDHSDRQSLASSLGNNATTNLPNPASSVNSGNPSVMGWLSLQIFYGRCAYQGTAEVSIYVANRYQGQGIGKELLKYAIANGPKIGITSLVGMIFAHNQPSLQLFSKLGFEKWGHLPQIARLDGVKRDLVILGLHLPNA